MARSTVQSMSHIWKSRGLSLSLKVRLLHATSFSIATYGSESWAMTPKNDRKRVDAFEMWCYRRLLHVSWKDKKTNVWVLDKIGTDLIIRRGIMERKLKYFGHIVRRSEGVEKQILQRAVVGKRGRGLMLMKLMVMLMKLMLMKLMVDAPISWTDDIKKVSGKGMKGATQMAGERVAWRTLVKTTAALYSAT